MAHLGGLKMTKSSDLPNLPNNLPNTCPWAGPTTDLPNLPTCLPLGQVGGWAGQVEATRPNPRPAQNEIHSTAPRHPARYTSALLPIFADVLRDVSGIVLDPFAGTGHAR